MKHSVFKENLILLIFSQEIPFLAIDMHMIRYCFCYSVQGSENSKTIRIWYSKFILCDSLDQGLCLRERSLFTVDAAPENLIVSWEKSHSESAFFVIG